MSPGSMTKPYFVSECRVAGFFRFGSVDENYVVDTFVPDPTVDIDLPLHPTDDPRDDL
jgi:hypothetical protein